MIINYLNIIFVASSKFPMMQQLGKTNMHSFGGKELIEAFALVLGSFLFARQKN